jgi:DNA topoisomerase-1
MATALDELTELYDDNKACAQMVGLSYVESEDGGISRLKQGRGFSYARGDKKIVDKGLKQRIADLVIPPAWQDVWIAPYDKAHVLATGTDGRGRKQYIYHPKWRTLRDLIKFYRMTLFAKALPKIRDTIETDLRRPTLDREKVLGVMLWLLDNTYIRVGNDVYLTENESVGLTTLSDKNLVVAGSVITLSFVGKSGKEQQITFDDTRIARIIRQLSEQRGSRLFRYKSGGNYRDIAASDLNQYLQETIGLMVSAKDFRTWGGTLMAFNHLVETLQKSKQPKPEQVVVQAVDAAANVLGNTRTVARSSYVHPHILQSYARENFENYYEKARALSARKGLDKRETELASVLEQLFEKEFAAVRNKK